jgi:FtsH-binding integral membrane protein
MVLRNMSAQKREDFAPIKRMASSCKYFIAKTFAHTAAGIGIAAISADNPVLYTALKKQLIIPGLSEIIIFVVTIALVFILPAMAPNTPLKYAAAIAFSFLIGQMSGPLVKALDEKNILARTLLLATGVFIGMVFVGLYDKNNMLGFGPYLLGALIGLIVAQAVLFILEATTSIKKQQYFQGAKVLSFFGIGLFSVFAAYDAQIVKMHARTCKKQGDYIQESTGLFLDFVNLFKDIGVLGLLDDN